MYKTKYFRWLNLIFSTSHQNVGWMVITFVQCTLRLHTGDKPYETSKSLWMVLFNCNDPMLSNQNRCGRDKRQWFIFYDTSHKQKWHTPLLFTTAKEHCWQSHWCQLDDKAVHCFQILAPAFSKYWFKHFIGFCSNISRKKTSKERHRERIHYMLIQMFCRTFA